MFGPAFYGVTHYGPTYFGPGSDIIIEPEPEGGGIAGGIFYKIFDEIIKEDIEDRDYRIDGKHGKLTQEITAKKVLRELPKDAIKAKIAEFRQMEVSAPQARALLEARADEIIKQMRLERVDQLNQQTLAIILTTVLSDE